MAKNGGKLRMPRETAQSKQISRRSAQTPAREITRSISARTRRSTSGGRLLSSQSFSIGRISSRTRSAIVGPPLNTWVLRSEVSARTRLVTEPAAAAAVSGEEMPGDTDMEALMGGVSVWGDMAGGGPLMVDGMVNGGVNGGGNGGDCGVRGAENWGASLVNEAGRRIKGGAICPDRGTGTSTGDAGMRLNGGLTGATGGEAAGGCPSAIGGSAARDLRPLAAPARRWPRRSERVPPPTASAFRS